MAATELFDVSASGSIPRYLQRAWQRRQYATQLALGQMRGAHLDTALGSLWHLLNPALQIGVYYVIFGLVLQTDRGVDNFLAFLAVGIFTFQFSQRSAISGANAIVKNLGLIRTVSFPRVVLPVSSTIVNALTFMPALVVMLAVVSLTGESPRWTWLLIVPLFMVQSAFNLGLAMLTSRATHTVRDLQNVLPFAFRLLFYGSGVLFRVDEYVADERYRLLFLLNPLYCIVAAYRTCVLGVPLADNVIPALMSACVLTVVIGFFWFRSGEADYGR